MRRPVRGRETTKGEREMKRRTWLIFLATLTVATLALAGTASADAPVVSQSSTNSASCLTVVGSGGEGQCNNQINNQTNNGRGVSRNSISMDLDVRTDRFENRFKIR